MMTDLPSLHAAVRRGASLTYLPFWKATPGPGGALGPGCLSQWWHAPFQDDAGVLYPTAEHYMMAEKARLFGDADVEAQILAASDPAQVKALGRAVRGFREQAWKDARDAIVMRASLFKFTRDADYRAYLLSTVPYVLVEASPMDRIWGVGLAPDDARVHTPHAWRGENRLGFALMRARDLLAEQAP